MDRHHQHRLNLVASDVFQQLQMHRTGALLYGEMERVANDLEPALAAARERL